MKKRSSTGSTTGEKTITQGRRVGAVAQLTGLSTHTIRAWERRHEAVRPGRTESGLRVYSEQDVLRLQLMKALTDRGEQIGTIAHLDEDTLRGRLVELRKGPPSGPAIHTDQARVLRLALIDTDLAQQIASNPAELLPIEVVVEASSVESLFNDFPDAQLDAIVIAIEDLPPDLSKGLTSVRKRFSDSEIWVTYTFASTGQLAKVVDSGAHLIRLPLRVAGLRDLIGSFSSSRRRAGLLEGSAQLDERADRDLSAPSPARRFTDKQLSRLKETPSDVACECPTQVASLIAALLAFENYSADCENANTADADLHQFLARGTGMARSVMEELLQRLCQQDNLAL